MEVLKIRTSPDAEWQEIVALRGYTPIKGVDYYTEAEKSALIQEVINSLSRAEEAEY